MGTLSPQDTGRLLEFGDFVLNPYRRELWKGVTLIRLTARPFDALLFLARNPGQLITREDLQRQVWGDLELSSNSVDQAISGIRRALNDDRENPRFILTVPRQGFRFISPVHEREATPCEPQPLPTTPVPAARRSRVGKRSATTAASVLAFSALLMAYAFRSPATPTVHRTVQLTHSSRPKLSPVLTDGKAIYFTEVESGRYQVSRILANGGAPERLALPMENPYLCDLSPDGSQLLVRSVTGLFDEPGPLWTVLLANGTAVRLKDLDAFDGRWSPDGSQIALARRHEIVLLSVDSGRTKNLVSSNGFVWWPRWSLDSRRLRFSVLDAKSQLNSIWEVPATGGRPTPLETGRRATDNECCGNWTPDGRNFIFQSTRSGSSQIWTLSEHKQWWRFGTLRPAPLTSGPVSLRGPAPSADGNTIYVRSFLQKSEILKYDRTADRYSLFLPGVSAGTIGFSPDGKWVAYSSPPDNALWKSRANGSEAVKLSGDGVQSSSPRWSPDGGRVAVMLRSPGGMWKIAVVSPQGTIEELTRGDFNEVGPSWSPDGKELIFGTVPPVEEPNRVALYTVDLARRKVRRLPGSDRLFNPRWSPAGRWVAAPRADTFRLALYDLQNGTQKLLTAGAATQQDWSPDGRYIYFLDPDAKPPTLYRIGIADGKLEPILSPDGLRHDSRLQVRWMGFHPDGSPLVVRDAGSQEVYALELTRP